MNQRPLQPCSEPFNADSARPRLVLASGSPRRKELLVDRLKLTVIVCPADIDETPEKEEKPDVLVQRLATQKAAAIAARWPGDVVIAADTVVVVDSETLGKPETPAVATTMLQRLSGERHHVMTGVAVHHRDRSAAVVDVTDVTFHPLSLETIAAYVATGDPLDKAGAYGIQGWAGTFVSRLVGSETGVIGLPLGQLAPLFHRIGVPLETFRR